MTKEQEETLEKVNRIRIDFFDSKYEDVHTDDELEEKYEALGDVLNMLKEKDKEIEKLKVDNENVWKLNANMSQRHLSDIFRIKKKDKQIDLMAEFIFQNIDVEEEICNSAYIECKQETAQDITCINCIKQYFERKSKK